MFSQKTPPSENVERFDRDGTVLGILVEHAPAAPVYAHKMFKMQATGGSSSTGGAVSRKSVITPASIFCFSLLDIVTSSASSG